MSTSKIGIDCRLSGNTHAGIGRYIENLITRLPLDKEIQWILFFSDQNQIPNQTHFQKAIADKTIVTKLVPIQHYTLSEQLQLPAIFAREELDLLHIPHFNVPLRLRANEKLIVTIHDLLWHEQKGSDVTTLPAWKYWIKYLGYKMVSSAAIAKAKTILVPSKAVKTTINNFYPNVDSKIVITYEGADQHTAEATNQMPIDKNKLLYVGSLYPHKNIKVVLEALQQNKDLFLEIAGSRNVFQDSVRHQAKKMNVLNQVVFLGYVEDKELLKKYQTSLALIQPSLSEGFGLTGLEAMSAGGTVLASDTAVFKEIYQDGAIYFDPHSASDLIKKIYSVQQLTTRQTTDLKEKATAVAKQYSWQKMVDQTVSEYLKLL